MAGGGGRGMDFEKGWYKCSVIPYHTLTDDELHILPVTAILIAIR